MVPIYTVSYVLSWVHFMYPDYCGILLLYIYIYGVLWVLIYTFWCLSSVHKMIPIYIECHSYYYGSCKPIIVGSYSMCTLLGFDSVILAD